MQTLKKQLETPGHAESRDAEDGHSDMFTDADWDMLMRGYTSQYMEHDFWLDDSMIEGAYLCLLNPIRPDWRLLMNACPY